MILILQLSKHFILHQYQWNDTYIVNVTHLILLQLSKHLNTLQYQWNDTYIAIVKNISIFDKCVAVVKTF